MSSNSTIKVWDLGVRLFHWMLVAAFVIAYATQDDLEQLHIYAGYTVLGLIIFRVLWGFVGTKYARFSNFVRSPGAVAGYLRSLLTANPKHYVGHNPAGGWMIVALLISLLVVTISGLKLYAVEEGRGPLAGVDLQMSLVATAYAKRGREDDDDHERRGKRHREEQEDNEGEEMWEELHESAVNFTLLLIALHLAGVAISSLLHKENLVQAMITGRKKG